MKKSLHISPLPLSAWDASLAHISEDMQGLPLNVHALMAHHPELLKAWWNFRNHAVGGGDLGRRRSELIILRVALQLRSWYEWGSHVERALACGLTIDEIERVKQGAQAMEWQPDEALLFTAVDELMTVHAITPETLNKLCQHYTVQQVMDLIAIQGMYVTLGGMLNTWGLKLDEHVKHKLPPSVCEDKFKVEFPR
ncbi:carboxymuconolactone decarboxylase family protein [Geopsychrobacter electrodiphilus]|uniref:carboxymuconolactone decarboxylase family protein n=1 Tax=Geopsychrobacter electrodiphilus TaxID=225196 RepID=UPI00037ACB93|nr:carboxymuconolactone decarboxylase family protein [Geopsychrobacter electrodiphilus]